MTESNPISTESAEEKPMPWLILTTVSQMVDTPVGKQNVASRIISWDFATKTQMETFWKKQLGMGTHYLVALTDAITLENLIQTAPDVAIKTN